jgi:hypothetical protein
MRKIVLPLALVADTRHGRARPGAGIHCRENYGGQGVGVPKKAKPSE